MSMEYRMLLYSYSSRVKGLPAVSGLNIEET